MFHFAIFWTCKQIIGSDRTTFTVGNAHLIPIKANISSYSMVKQFSFCSIWGCGYSRAEFGRKIVRPNSSVFCLKIKTIQWLKTGYSGSVFSDEYGRTIWHFNFFFGRTVTKHPSSGMDVKQLISPVFEKKCPWDIKENYHNRDLKRRSWEDISEEIDKTGQKSSISHTDITSDLN